MPDIKKTTNFHKLKKWARNLKTEVLALYYAYRDPRVPLAPKIFTAFIVAYALSPIDLIPDFIPILGYLDDLLILPLCISIAVRMIPKDVLRDSREKAKLLTFRPQSKIAALIIICIWITAMAATARLVFKL